MRLLITLAAWALTWAPIVGASAARAAGEGRDGGSGAPIRVLLLSGANNHDWKTTTPRLEAILEGTGRFSVDVLEETGTWTSETLAGYRVIVSNFNTFTARYRAPRDPGWSDEARDAYVEFVRGGGGHVVVHAGSSSFYDWPEYQEIVLSSFRVGRTDHGARHAFPVRIDAGEHPITAGLGAFTTFDELWHEAPVPDGAIVLASAFSSRASRGSGHYEPVAMAGSYGTGRSFTLLLGHDLKAMESLAFQAFLARGTEWAATGSVTLPLPPPADWPGIAAGDLPATEDPMRWRWGDGMLALVENERVIWQFNYGVQAGKPHFHPVALPGGAPLTWQDPPDHPWHHGLWFSWKLIDGVNYWEEDRTTGQAEGRTEWSGARITTEEDHSARIEMDLVYREPGAEPVLTERRVIEVAPPEPDGTYHLDWMMTFTAVRDVLLDRTPLPDEPGGMVFGGYAGLSLRLASGLAERHVVTSDGSTAFADDRHRSRATAMDYSGQLHGARMGVAILDHPENLNAPSPWYAIKGPVMSYFSPAVICYGPHRLAAGDALTLRYRVLVHGDGWNSERLATEAERFSGETGQ